MSSKVVIMMMKNNIKPPILAVLMSSLLFLLSCGGGITGGNSIVDGGITGTGITAGRITNFGSIFVNGIQFDVDNAIFSRDGVNSQQSDFLVGEYVLIKGDVSTTGISGKASEVIFTDSLEGQVTVASTDDISLEVLGQKVKTDQLSIFHDFNSLTDLTVGNIVEVSGLRDSTGQIIASSIELKQVAFISGVSENEVKGIVSNVNQTQMSFQLGNINVDFSNAELDDFVNGVPAAGQFVEVKSSQPIAGNVIQAFKVELEDDSLSLSSNDDVEIEGLVTRFVSALDFDVSGIPVTIDSSTEFQDGTVGNLELNALVEIEGSVNSLGIVVVDKIKFKDLNNEIRIEDSIQSINLQVNEVVVAGTTIIIDVNTLMRDKSDQEVSPLTINDLAVGDKVDVRGFALSDGKVMATRFERDD